MIYPRDFEQKVGFDVVRTRLSELCVSPQGRRKVEEMGFSTNFENVKTLLYQTWEMLKINELPDHITPQELPEFGAVMGRLKIEGSFLSASELFDVGRLLWNTGDWKNFFLEHNTADPENSFHLLGNISESLDPLPEITRQLSRTLDRYGNVLDSASPELSAIRKEITATSGRINSVMRRVISHGVAEGYLDPDVSPTMRDGRLVLPVQPMNKRKVPGIVHDESASGKTYFIEPAEVVQANNRVRELQLDEKREIIRILTAVTSQLRPFADILATNAETLSIFDFIHAKALYAKDIAATLPTLHQKPGVEWYHATHPILLENLRRQHKELVPLDITLTPHDRILVISGPNAGGKSVCLKTVGIVQYMTQCGLLPPVYSNSHVGIFRDIFINIGDNQSIENELSTYSSHLRDMKQFLMRGNKNSLVLIDEFGSGTEPQIGGALAQAILKEFNSDKLWGVITTHYQNLKQFAEQTPGLINGSMLYDRQKMEPLFKLHIGNAGSSFAIEIARKTGLPQNIIDEARNIVGEDYINLDKYLLDIARDKRYWESKRDSIKKREKQLEEIISRYEDDADKLREKRREIIEDAKNQAKEILANSNATIERTIREIRSAAAEKEATKLARIKFEEEKKQIAGENIDVLSGDHKLLRKAPKKKKQKVEKHSSPESIQLTVGSIVKLDGNGVPGEILEINGKSALVAFGILKTSVAIDRLKPTMAKVPSPLTRPTAASAASSDSSRQRQLNFKPEIDVRGMRAEEAVQAVTYFIDDALQFNVGRVRILHGTGTGALRVALRGYLATITGVKNFHDEDVRFGGAGITVVELN